MDIEGSSPWADAAQGSQSGPGSAATPSKSQADSSSAAGSSRTSRLTPRRLVAQPTKLESVEDDPLGPLGGPLGGSGAPSDSGLPDSPPEPPQKEQSQLPVRTTLPQQPTARRQAPTDPHHIDDDDDEDDELDGRQTGPRPPPPVQAAQPSLVRSSTQPSVSIEQAAKPTFNISVGDPAKVGDLTSSHIVYSVRTKVR
jgi:sorting nexin-1/2